MSRTKSAPDNGGTATAEPKTRQRKSKAERVNAKLVRVLNAIQKLGDLDLPESGEKYVISALEERVGKLDAEWQDARSKADEEPETITVSVPVED